MPTPDENKIMLFLDEEGGQGSILKVSRELGVRIDYARIICESLGRRDFIDVFANGRLGLTRKGWKTIGKKGRTGVFREQYRFAK